MYAPDVPATARRIAFWLAVAVGVMTAVRLVALVLVQAGVVGTASSDSTIVALIALINLLVLGESALAAYFCRVGDTRRAKWAFVVVAFLGLLNLVPTVLALLALWLLRRRSVIED